MITDDPGFSGTECLSGENACPPEDIGGIWGYTDMLEAIKNPEHEDYEELQESFGPDFDPATFDLKKVNASIKRIKV